MDLKVGNLPVPAIHVGSTPVKSVYVGSKLVWSATVQITLGNGYEARDQFRAALTERGLDYQTITEVPFEIELVGSGSIQEMFRHCSALTTAPAMDTSNVVSMNRLFHSCYALTSVPDMKTSNVTDMSFTFYYCQSLTDGNVRLMGKNPNVYTSNMIDGSSLTREPFDTVQITLSTAAGNYGARNQFRAALSDRGMNYSTVTEVPFEIELVGTGSVEQLFQDCYALTHVPNMDTSQVTNMQDMFSQCRSLTYAPDMDTSKVTNMRGVFYNCYALTYVPWMDMSQAVDSPYMFANCRSLTYVPDMDTSKVTGMRSMFLGCSSLIHAPALDTSQVVDSAYMFDGCSALVYVPDMDVSQNVDFYAMFRNCSSLTDGNVRLFGYKSGNTISMIEGSGLTKEPFIEVYEVTLTNVQGSNTAHSLVSVTVPAGKTWSVRIQGTITKAPRSSTGQPVFRIGASTSGRYGNGATVNYSGTITAANSTIAMVTAGTFSLGQASFTGTVTIEK